MFKNILFLLFVIITFLSSMKLRAVEVQGLYQASVEINSQNGRDRAVALKRALAAVMLKVGGEQSVLENEVIKRALNNHRLYLTQYRYQHKTLQVTDDKDNVKQLFLLASFNSDKINQLFQEANLPLWGSLRPQVLLWLVHENGLSRNIISNSSLSKLPFMVNEFSAQRGLPIMMPLMDLIDANQIKLSDVWGRFQEPIKNASNRYLPETIAVMRISDSSLVAVDYDNTEENTPSDCGLLCVQSEPNEQRFVLDWSLLEWGGIEGQQKFSQQYLGEDPQLLLRQGLADITELIYKRYALLTTSQNDLTIEVSNIDSLMAYVEVFEFLGNLSSVKSVKLLNAKGNVRRFKLGLRGSKEALLASLMLSKQLTQYIDPLANFNEPIDDKSNEKQVPIFNWSK
jgi:hypothetical protein